MYNYEKRLQDVPPQVYYVYNSYNNIQTSLTVFDNHDISKH